MKTKLTFIIVLAFYLIDAEYSHQFMFVLCFPAYVKTCFCTILNLAIWTYLQTDKKSKILNQIMPSLKIVILLECSVL